MCELRVQLTNIQYFSELLKLDFRETTGLHAMFSLCHFIRLLSRSLDRDSLNEKFRLTNDAEIGGYVNDTK